MAEDYGMSKFKRWAKRNNLRLERSEDGLPIVMGNKTKKYKEAHLYEGFGTKYLGLYVECHSKTQFSHMVNRLTGERKQKNGKVFVCEPIALGETDGTFKIKWTSKAVTPVVQFFKMSKFKRVCNLNR